MKTHLLALLLVSATCTCVSAQAQLAVAAPVKTTRLEKKPDFFTPFSGKAKTNTTSRRYATCANRPGVLQLGIGYGTTIGGGWVTVSDSVMSYSQPGIGMTYNINFRFQYGITEGLSLGFYARKDVGAYGTTSLDAFYDGFTINGLSFGFEGKGYVLNNEKFAVYIAPTVGATFASNTINDFEKNHAGKSVGLNYGIAAGLNWYWTDALGMSVDIGYGATSLAGVFNHIDLAGMDYQMKYGGIYAGAGLVLKFDTRHY